MSDVDVHQEADGGSADAQPRPVCNIAAYKFIRLRDLAERRLEIRRMCEDVALKGTVLISPEGINLCLAGARGSAHRFLKRLRRSPEFHDLEAKVSFSQHQPFRRLLVKIKREIIAFDDGRLSPAEAPTPKLDALTLKQWLDEGRPVTLLDVRNDYEVRLGAFHNAVPIGTESFRQFPARVDQLPDELKQNPIVMYCTGGIRCEKAGPYMQQAGFREVYQLDGGILKYFERCGDAHYDGECFVFDHRVAVDGALSETDTALCFACQAPLTADDQASPEYVPGASCPYCFVTPVMAMQRRLHDRHVSIQRLCDPLPGSIPYENRRPMHVAGKCAGWTLIEFVADLHPQVPRSAWEQIIAAGRIERRSETLAADARLAAGDRIEHVIPYTLEPDINPRIRILHEDDAIVVVNKPAPLPMHPCGRFNRNTLIHLLNQVYRPQKLRLTHRLDANTTGVTVLARTRAAAARLRPQFVEGLVEKRYLVRVVGRPSDEYFSVDEAIGAQATKAGARRVDRSGRSARTEFRVIKEFGDGTTLLGARPLTGRTNQIRLHLAHVELPVLGDPVYTADQPSNRTSTLGVHDPPLCLHAWQISFTHPTQQQATTHAAPPPAWAER